MKKTKIVFAAVVLALHLALQVVVLPKPAKAWRSIVFPVAGPARFVNDYYAPRPGRIHGATDIMAPKGRPLLAAVDGIITYVAYPEPSWGYMVTIEDAEGYEYNYLHVNNDNPGTNDNIGGGMNAYAPDINEGNRVYKGQLIGWVGDSGRANGVPHLHFEIFHPNGDRENPYDSLTTAERRDAPIAYHPQLPNETLPYGQHYRGGINIARGNFDADPESETVVGAGSGGGPHIRLFDDDDTPLGPGFYAYHAGFYGGVDVATGDFDSDGIDEIITAAGPSGGPHVRILKLDGTEFGGFYAYHPSFAGGVRVGAGDVDSDGIDEIITGPIFGAPHVRVLRANGTEVSGFYAYSPDFTGGVDVAAGDVTGSSDEEVIIGAGPGGGPHIRVMSGLGVELTGFYAFSTEFHGGTRVSVGNVRITGSPKSEILVMQSVLGSPHIRMFSGTPEMISEGMMFESWWVGYFDIAAGYDDSRTASGINRRATLRNGLN